MARTVHQTNLLQPVQGLLLGFPPVPAAHQQRHGHILDRSKLRQQIMKLPDKSKFTAAELRRLFFRELPQIELGEVYVTFRGPIKHSEDVQQGTFPGTRLANNGQHLAGLHLERQVFKEH